MQILETQHFKKGDLPCKLTTYKIDIGNYAYGIERQYYRLGKLQDVTFFIDGLSKENLDKKVKTAIKLLQKGGFEKE